MTPVGLAALAAAGLAAGFVDSIAGGGGLITLPTLTLAVGAGPAAIGSNKIVGTVGAAMALLVYLRAGHVDWKRTLAFSAWVGLGSWCGSRVSPLVPLDAFRWILLATCPLILWIVWRKDLWIAREVSVEMAEHGSGQAPKPASPASPKLLAAGFCVGFYDGAWGPGGGTFMFLALHFIAGLPLLGALAAAKFANTCSAGVALVSYARAGYVHWLQGFSVAGGMAIGAYVGASHATRHASRIVRPILAVAAGLLALRLALG